MNIIDKLGMFKKAPFVPPFVRALDSSEINRTIFGNLKDLGTLQYIVYI